jgi:hypothetical protein
LGIFDTPIEAAMAHDEAARLIPGKQLNFPQESSVCGYEIVHNYLGVFDTDVEAAHAHDKAARLIPLHKKLNFPSSIDTSDVIGGTSELAGERILVITVIFLLQIMHAKK